MKEFGRMHRHRDGRCCGQGHGAGCQDGPHHGMRGGFGGGCLDDERRGGRGHGGHGHGRHGGRGRRRMFDGGELRLVLLKLIAETPRHGYDLIRAIEERTSGAYAPSPGVVYPTLTLLTDMDLITETASEGARKLFAATPKGLEHLGEEEELVSALFKRLDAVSQEQERTDAVPVRRALQNLRAVLQNKLIDGLEADKLQAAVGMIDEVAGKIERL